MSVWLCPGQGAQKPAMGADLLDCDEFAQVKSAFTAASEIMGIDLAALAHTGTEEQVNETYAAQALTAAVSIGIGLELLERGHEPEAIIGFSLGQVSALALSGMLDVRDAFELLKARAHAMEQACSEHPGAMAALLGASHDDARELCATCAEDEVLLPANYNCPGQVVISGDIAAIERAEASWAASHGARKVSRLRTAGGFHTPLMAPAAKVTGETAQKLEFREPRVTVLCNTDACELTASNAAERMRLQVMSPVCFEQSVAKLLEGGARNFTEVGFGSVLTGLVKRCDRTATRRTIGTAEELKASLGL